MTNKTEVRIALKNLYDCAVDIEPEWATEDYNEIIEYIEKLETK